MNEFIWLQHAEPTRCKESLETRQLVRFLTSSRQWKVKEMQKHCAEPQGP